MTKKVMLIYRIIILIPYVNLISFFLWAIHLTYCLIVTPMKKISDVIIRPALSLLAMVAAWKVVSIIYGAITNGGGGSAAAGILFIYFAGLAVGIVCYISSALTQKQREKILAEKNDEE